MKHLLFGTAAAFVAFLAFSIAQSALAAMAAVDEKLFNSCMAMEPGQMKGNVECMSFFKRMIVVVEDLDVLRACRGMQTALLNHDKECAVMLAKHPDLVKPAAAAVVTPGGADATRAK